jgi:hypothetical protein
MFIPATWEVEVGGLRSEAGPDKSMRPYLKNKLGAKGLRCSSGGRALSKCKALSSMPSTKKN